LLNTRLIVKNLTSSAALRLASAAVTFGLFVFLAQTWGVSRLGEYSTALAYFFFLQQLPLLGLHVVLIRDVGAHPDRVLHEAVNAAVLAMGVAVVLAFGLGITGGLLYEHELRAALWLVAASIVPSGFIAFAESILVGKERVAWIAVVTFAENLTRAVACVVLVYLGYGVVAVFGCFLATRVAVAIFYYFRGGIRSYLERDWLSREELLRYLRMSPVFLGIVLFSAGISRIDVIMLSSIGTLRDVGLYSTGYKIFEVGLMVPSLFTLVIFPSFARFYAKSSQQFALLTRYVFRLCLLIGFPVAALVACYASNIVTTIFGPEYADSARVLQLLSFAAAILATDQVLTMVLLASHRQNQDLLVLAVSCTLYVLLLAVLIPARGVQGAAIATLSTALIQAGTRYAVARRTVLADGLLSLLVVPVVALASMALLLFVARDWPPAVTIAVALAGYVSVLMVFGALTRSDLAALKTSLSAKGP